LARKRKKEVGKVVVKKKARNLPSISIRKDVLLVAIIIILIAGGVAYIYVNSGTAQAKQALTPSQELYKGLQAVFKDKNKRATLDLYYRVRGTVDVGGVPTTVMDLLQFRIFYYNQSIKPQENQTNTTTFIAGYAALPIGTYYIFPLLNLTGFTDMIDNASEIIINVPRLTHTYNVSLEAKYLGEERIYLRGMKATFNTSVYLYSYSISNEGKVKNVTIKAYFEDRYNLPVKVVVTVDSQTVAFQLETAVYNVYGSA
jgi:hypothetical protein